MASFFENCNSCQTLRVSLVFVATFFSNEIAFAQFYLCRKIELGEIGFGIKLIWHCWFTLSWFVIKK